MKLTEYMVQEPYLKSHFLYNRAIFIWHNNLGQDLKVHWGMKLNKETHRMSNYGDVRSRGRLMFRLKPRVNLVKEEF